MYKNYKNARDAAWKVLIRHKICSLPVNIEKICAREGIMLLPYSKVWRDLQTLGMVEHSRRTDGFSMKYNSHTLLFYDDTKSRQRQRFTIAHEFGHFINGDISDVPTAQNIEPTGAEDVKETAANVTASRILSPACVLWRLGVFDAPGIAGLCDISLTAARWRAARLYALCERDRIFWERYGHGCFLQSSLERKVFLQFFGKS